MMEQQILNLLPSLLAAAEVVEEEVVAEAMTFGWKPNVALLVLPGKPNQMAAPRMGNMWKPKAEPTKRTVLPEAVTTM